MSQRKKSTTKSPVEPKARSKKKAAKATAKASPTTPDSMSEEVVEFITAIDDYKRKNQRLFPNWSEVLEIVKALGYSRD